MNEYIVKVAVLVKHPSLRVLHTHTHTHRWTITCMWLLMVIKTVNSNMYVQYDCKRFYNNSTDQNSFTFWFERLCMNVKMVLAAVLYSYLYLCRLIHYISYTNIYCSTDTPHQSVHRVQNINCPNFYICKNRREHCKIDWMVQRTEALSIFLEEHTLGKTIYQMDIR